MLELRIRQGRPLALVIPVGIRFVAVGGGNINGTQRGLFGD